MNETNPSLKILKIEYERYHPKHANSISVCRPGNKDVCILNFQVIQWLDLETLLLPNWCKDFFSDMSWLPEERFPYSWWQSILIKILRCGSLPSHVAFIMDGNLRFAKQNQLETIEAHIQGFEKLAQTLQWCHDLGINQVTVYAFRYTIIGLFYDRLFHWFSPNSRQSKLNKLSKNQSVFA